MFNQLIEQLKKLLPNKRIPFDPTVFDDPVALKTGWGPVKGGGSNFCSHVLRLTADGRAMFRPSVGLLVFCSLFLLIGLAVDIAITLAFIKSAKPMLKPEYLVPLGLGSVFTVVGAGMMFFLARPVVFDRQSGRVWRGWKDPRQDFEHGEETTAALCMLDEVHAIQIVSEYVRGNKSSYTSYELNLVRVDGTRVNVVDHGDIDQIRKDAAMLGEYLEAAVWDATL